MTVTTPTDDRQVAEYLADVAAHLDALPEADRAELLDDLARHLAEVAAEPGPPLAERLGSPAAYAAELLASAGVHVDPERRSAVDRLNAAWADIRVAVEAVRSLGRELRPAWWLVRGLLAAWLVSELFFWSDGGWALILPAPNNRPSLGLGLVVGLSIVSIALGRRRFRWWGFRWAVVAINISLLIFGVVNAVHDDRRSGSGISGAYMQEQLQAAELRTRCLRSRDGHDIQNVYAYDANGNRLDRVLLYDERGLPIDSLCLDVHDAVGNHVEYEVPKDVHGRDVPNAFPYDWAPHPEMPGAKRSHPGPAIAPPKLAPATPAD